MKKKLEQKVLVALFQDDTILAITDWMLADVPCEIWMISLGVTEYNTL
jgi:hypothetical protein